MQKRFSRVVAGFCILLCAFCILPGCRPAASPLSTAKAPPVPEVWGKGRGNGPGQFYEPRAMAIAPDHFVYIVDSTGRVHKWTDDGKFVKAWRVPSIDKGRPEGIAVCKSGNLAVCDTHYSKIRIYTPDGKLLRSFGVYGTQPGGFLLATGICTDGDGFLYIADYGGEHDRISKWTEDGKLVASWTGHGEGPRQFRRPCGVAISKEGDLLVADICNHRIQRLDRKTGAFKGQIGTPGRAPGQLTYVYGVATDAAGFIYTVEYATCRVQKWTSDGKFLAGWGAPGRAPGQLFNPWGLAVTRDGTVYVADTGNHRVQKFRFESAVTTPAAG